MRLGNTAYTGLGIAGAAPNTSSSRPSRTASRTRATASARRSTPAMAASQATRDRSRRGRAPTLDGSPPTSHVSCRRVPTHRVARSCAGRRAWRGNRGLPVHVTLAEPLRGERRVAEGADTDREVELSSTAGPPGGPRARPPRARPGSGQVGADDRTGTGAHRAPASTRGAGRRARSGARTARRWASDPAPRSTHPLCVRGPASVGRSLRVVRSRRRTLASASSLATAR